MSTIFLRALELDDLDRLHQWHNDPDLYNTLIGTFRCISRDAEEEWLRKRQSFSPNEINLAICLVSDSQHIGNIYLRNIDWISRHAELHVFIGDKQNRSQGFGQEAVRQIIIYAFNELGLHRLHLLVLAENLPAIHIYEKCGFHVEGRLRSHVYKAGEFKDVLFMGVSTEDLAQTEWGV